jgi:hypothetical protein
LERRVKGFSHTLHLPTDDSKIFGYMLRWLYTHQLPSGEKWSDLPAPVLYHQLMKLYAMGEKYGLNNLQDQIVPNLEKIEITSKVFFHEARNIFGKIPSQKGSYFGHFDNAAKRHIRDALEENWMLEMMEEGGPFVVALGKVLGSLLQSKKSMNGAVKK